MVEILVTKRHPHERPALILLNENRRGLFSFRARKARMAQKLKPGDMVEFIRFDIASKHAQVKRVYDWTPCVSVALLPDKDIREAHLMVTNVANVKRI